MADSFPPTIRGFDVWECVSALQKAIRRGEEASALTWAVELDQSGYAKMLWSRLIVIAAEDVGLADPTMVTHIKTLYDTHQMFVARKNKHMPERLYSTQAVMMLVRAPKSRMVDNAVWATYGHEDPLVDQIPDYALDAHTQAGRDAGKGKTAETNPDSFALENEADLGPNPYAERKTAYRERVGMKTSQEWFKKQGSRSYQPQARPKPQATEPFAESPWPASDPLF